MSKAVTYQHIGPTSPPSLKHQQSVDQDMNWHSWKDQAKHEQFTNCRGQKVPRRMSKFEWSLETRLFCLWPPWNNMENKNDDFSGYPKDGQASTVRSWNWMIGLALVASLVGPCISICQCMSTISYHDLFNRGNRGRSLQSCICIRRKNIVRSHQSDFVRRGFLHGKWKRSSGQPTMIAKAEHRSVWQPPDK